ncbi:hypothetical protein CQ054_22640 [Ochrobactrum sp. MYb29]|nr:hypothetical protein CQ054_22640 [Ochrobactrum sp. MYb29]
MSRKKREILPLSRALQTYFDKFRADPTSIDAKFTHYLVNQSVRSALNCGMVKEVKALLEAAGSGPNATELRYLLSKGGRPPFGTKNLVTWIGRYNEKLKKQGVTYSERVSLIKKNTGIQTEGRIKEVLSEFRKEETALFSDIAPEYLTEYRALLKRRDNGEQLSSDEERLIHQIENYE